MANHVRNTTAVTDADLGLAILTGGSEAFIMGQEAQGQRQLVESSVVPAEMREPRAVYEALGFKFGEPVDGDPLFINAELPPGWSRAATDHAMWSTICDEKGRVRVKVFYKAAFYDRRADMGLERRYDVIGLRPDGPRSKRTGVAVVDGATGEHLWTGGPDDLEAADAWLDANRPNHRDVVASWAGA